MRQFGKKSIAFIAAASLVFLFVAGGASTAAAGKKIKSKKSEGKLVSLDPEAGTMIVKEKGKKRIYQVKFEGSVLKRTTSTMNAKPVKLMEIPVGAPVIVYWKPDPKDKKIRHARKVDAPKVPEDLLEQYD